MIKYPHITVHLVGNDGNAFAILGNCKREAERAGLSKEEIESFFKEAKSGDYDNLLRVCQKWFNCE